MMYLTLAVINAAHHPGWVDAQQIAIAIVGWQHTDGRVAKHRVWHRHSLGDDIRGRGQAIAVRDDMLGVKSGCTQWMDGYMQWRDRATCGETACSVTDEQQVKPCCTCW